jgi:hypothetical protein
MADYNTGFVLADEMREDARDDSYYLTEAEIINREYRNG